MKNLFNETVGGKKKKIFLLWKIYFQEKLLKLIGMEDEEIRRIRLRSRAYRIFLGNLPLGPQQ